LEKFTFREVRNGYPKLILRQRQQYLNWPLSIFKALIRVFPLLGFHNVGSLFAPVDAILVERAEHSVLLVDGVEERADMIHPARLTPASSTECPCFAIFRLMFSLEIKAPGRSSPPMGSPCIPPNLVDKLKRAHPAETGPILSARFGYGLQSNGSCLLIAPSVS